MMPDYAYIPTVYQSKSNPYFSNLAKFGPKGAGAQETARKDILRGAVPQAALRKVRSAAASRSGFSEKST
jgi:hypothetical protein